MFSDPSLTMITKQNDGIGITGWPLELMAYAYLAVSPSSMRGDFEEVWHLNNL